MRQDHPVARGDARRAQVTLDDPLERSLAREDPARFLDQFGTRPITIDEFQHVPELTEHLKPRVDRRRDQPGQWLLTGSQQFATMRAVSESLAGRVAILELLPFSLHERPVERLEEAVWQGGYPEPALNPDRRALWARSYLAAYVERDLRAFEQFLGLLAARHAQELNASALARDVGVSPPTIKAWLSVLTASCLAFLLPP